jgi:hypothetical protein
MTTVAYSDTLRDAVFIALDQIGGPARVADVVHNLIATGMSPARVEEAAVAAALEDMARENRILHRNGIYLSPNLGRKKLAQDFTMLGQPRRKMDTRKPYGR